jgi:hypothetical protein
MASKPAKKAPKKKGLYDKPKDLKMGDILTDTRKINYLIGKVIGAGGFGVLYSACISNSRPSRIDDYPYVVKIVSLWRETETSS